MSTCRRLRVGGGALVAITLAACWSLDSSRPARADSRGPVSIIAGSVTIAAPEIGGTVRISGSVEGTFHEYSAPMSVWARSVTRDELRNGGNPRWQSLRVMPNRDREPASFDGRIFAAYGDLIEIRATNVFYGSARTDRLSAGFVPAAVDTTPPIFTDKYIEASYSGGELGLSVTSFYAFEDSSHPIEFTLSEVGSQTNRRSGRISSHEDSFPMSVSIAIGRGKRARLVATDAYGNSSHRIFDTSSFDAPSASGKFLPETMQSPAERTGQQARAGLGVNLHNGGLVHREALFRIEGVALALDVSGVYRSRIQHDGLLGQRWDSILSSRVELDEGANLSWFPGDGRRERFSFESSGTDYFWLSERAMPVRAKVLGAAVTIETRHGQMFTYSLGRLARITDRNGNEIRFERDWRGRILRIANDLGRFYHLAYDAAGRLAEVLGPAGRRTTFRYDGVGHLVAISDPAGYTRRFEYARGRLVSRFDRNDRRIVDIAYDEDDRVVRQSLPLGSSQVDGRGGPGSYFFDYTDRRPDDPGLVSRVVVDPLGTEREYIFREVDPVGLLSETITRANPELRESVAGYDWDQVAREVVSCVEHDPRNLLPRRTWIEADFGAGRIAVTPYTWRSYTRVEQRSAADDPRAAFDLRLLREDLVIRDDHREFPAERQSWTYSPEHQLVVTHHPKRSWSGVASGSDPSSPENPEQWSRWEELLDDAFATRRVHDESGNLLELRHPDVSVPVAQTDVSETFTYNERGQMLSSTSSVGVTRYFEYYENCVAEGRLARRWIDVPGEDSDPSDSYEYDPFGHVVAHTDGRGSRTEFARDGLGRVIERRDPPTRYLGALATRFEFDGEHLLRVIQPNLDEFGRVPHGQPAEVVETFVRDQRSGALTKRVQDVHRSQDTETLYEHDALLRRVRTHEQFDARAGGQKRYRVSEVAHDELGRVIRSIGYLSDPLEEAPDALFDDMVEDIYFAPDGRVARRARQVERVGESMRRHVTELSTRYLDTLEELAQAPEDSWLATGRYRVDLARKPDGKVEEVVTDMHAGRHEWSRRESTVEVRGGVRKELERTEIFVDERDREYRRRVYFELGSRTRYFDEETWSNEAGQTIREYDEFTGTGDGAPFHLYSYDPAGRLAVVVAPEGKKLTTYTYDATGNVLHQDVEEELERSDGTVDLLGHRTEYSYDARGRCLSAASAGRARRFFYDSHGRVRREVLSRLGLETRTFYDLRGSVIETHRLVDRASSQWTRTSYRRDRLGRLLALVSTSPSDSSSRVSTLFLRDDYGQGRLDLVVLPGGCSLDMLGGELCAVEEGDVDPAARYAYEYDLAGRLTSSVDPNGTVIANHYDSPEPGVINEVVVSAAPDVGGVARISYDYGANGQCGCAGASPTRMVTRDAAGIVRSAVERSFDAVGELTREEVVLGRQCPEGDGFGPCSTSGKAWYTVRYERDTDTDGWRRDDGVIVESSGVESVKELRLRRILDANGRLVEARTSFFSKGDREEPYARFWYQGLDKIVESHFEHVGVDGEVARIVRQADHELGGRGLRTTNVWGTQRKSNRTGAWGALDEIYDWSATYDEAGRIETKKIGPLGFGAAYEFDFDARDRLRRATYDWPDEADSDSQWRDARSTTYDWNDTGSVARVGQCFVGAGGTLECTKSDSVLERDDRGRVVKVRGLHVLAYHPDGAGVSRAIGPQSRSYDRNGNLTSLSFVYRTYNIGQDLVVDEAQSYCERHVCDDSNLRSEQLHTWKFEYDAWDRPVALEKEVEWQGYTWESHSDLDGCCREAPLSKSSYVVRYENEFDGLGRRLATRIRKKGLDTNASGVSEQVWLNARDAAGRVLARVDVDGDDEVESIHYFPTDEALPAMAVFAAGNSAGIPHFFLSDVEGNAGALLDASTFEPSDERSTQHCGSSSKNGSNPQAIQQRSGNVYGNSYGETEDGLQLVEDPNCSPIVLMTDGSWKDTELKDRAKVRRKAPGWSPDATNSREKGWTKRSMHNLLGGEVIDRDFGPDDSLAKYAFASFWDCHCKHGRSTLERSATHRPIASARRTRYAQEQQFHAQADFEFHDIGVRSTAERDVTYRAVGSWEEINLAKVAGHGVSGGLVGAGLAVAAESAGVSFVSGPAAPWVFAGLVTVGIVGGAIDGAGEDPKTSRAELSYRFRFSCRCAGGRPRFSCTRVNGGDPRDAGDLYWKKPRPANGRCR